LEVTVHIASAWLHCPVYYRTVLNANTTMMSRLMQHDDMLHDRPLLSPFDWTC
jgi:hypothetical protein